MALLQPILMLAGIAIVIMWLIFPFLILSKMENVLQELKSANEKASERHAQMLDTANKTYSNTAVIAQASSPETPVE